MSEMIIDQSKNPDNFVSQNFLLVPTHKDEYIFIISGSVIIDYKTASPQWKRDTLRLKINLPPWLNQFSANGSLFRVADDDCTPWVTVNAIADEDAGNHIGWTLEDFKVDEQRASDKSFEISTQANIKADISVRDQSAKGFVLRVGYHCTYLGKFVGSRTN